MFLKRLEIHGFKSFCEKIRLDFKKGITAVVGPNGSGKSNISDAIRWVLGEQSAKTLRGDKMEDVIFAGTENRKPLGFAEVTIYLDNSDKKLNLDYEEIAITRKVYRSNDSAYFINGTNCRLKDIHELFMDTGIGKEGYSIIGQGKIDAILNNKSEDRRALFEEAVGIIKFKNRKMQAENKLQEVRKNLIRTNDIITELEKQINPLFEQQEKAKQFLSISEKLKIVRINLFTLQYKQSENDIKNTVNNIEALNNTILSLQNEKQNYIIKDKEFKNNLSNIEQQIEKLNQEISNININIEQKQNAINLNNQSINFIKEDIDRIKNEKLKNNQSIIKNNEQIKLINVNLEAKNLEYTLKNDELSILYKQLKNISNKMDKNEEKFKNINNEIVEKIQLSSSLSNKLTIYKTSKENLNEKKIQIEQNISVFKSKINEKTARKMVLEKNLIHIKENEKNINQIINTNNLNLNKIQQELINIKKLNSENNKKYIQLKNKHKILEELEKDYEGYFHSVKAILKEKEKNNKFNGVCNAIGELIKVPKQYEVALEIALGGAIQNIVTKTEEDAKISIEYLKQNKKGRATFLPISSIKAKPITKDKDNILKEKGIIGIADTLINFDKKYLNIMSNLLGKTIIIDNINNGVNFSKKYNYMYKIVTLDGELINIGGALTGGSISKKSSGIFSRSREIKDIFDDICILENSINQNNIIINDKEYECKNIQKNIEQSKQNLHKNTLEKIKIKADIEKTEEYIKDFENNINNNKLEFENVENQIKNTYLDNNNLEDELNKVNNEIENLKLSIIDFESEINKEKSNKNEKFNYINQLKIDIKEIEYQINNNKKDILRLSNEIKNLKNINIMLNKNIDDNNNKQTDLNKSIVYTQQTIETLKQKHNSLKSSINNLQQEKTNINNNISDMSKNILNVTTNIADIENKKIKLEAKIDNIQEKLDTLCDNMWQDYEITYASACNEYKKINLSFDELKKQENSFKKKIASLGNINVEAIEQYKLIKERYELNIKQRDDILKADEDLKYIISTLVKEMEQQFKKQFYLINQNFSKVFSDIFGGGKAELILLDKENILSSGIDIVAQPTGKKLQSLTLLSGGERTLTAISLLFAILIMKPSPFCVLDETEAALDDANVLRYANFLKRFSKDNQFILITHKTGIMEMANILYGVTMEEQGISKIVSVQLKDAKEYEKS